MSSPDTAWLEEINRTLADAPADEIVRWAAEHYGDRLCLATVLDAEGCVLALMLAQHAPHTRMLLPDTGYQPDEVAALSRYLAQRHGVLLHPVHPSTLHLSYESDFGPLRAWNPRQCCRLRRWEPLRDALAPFAARLSARRREQCAAFAELPPLCFDTSVNLLLVNPLARWTREDVRAYLTARDFPLALLEQGGTCQGCAYGSCGAWETTWPAAPPTPRRHWWWPLSPLFD